MDNVVSAGNLLNLQKLSRLEQFAQSGMIFEELYKGRATDSYRRYLQRRFVSAALDAIGGRGAETTDGRALILGTLTDIQKKAAKAKSSDTATQAHWKSIASTIEKALK